jgi:threonine dehydratase
VGIFWELGTYVAIGADDALQSFTSGKIVTISHPQSVADGLLTAALGTLTFPIIKENAEAILTVSEEEIKAAMKLMWERMKIVVEPSGAVSFAAVLSHKLPKDVKRVGIVVSGGNVDLLKWKFE